MSPDTVIILFTNIPPLKDASPFRFKLFREISALKFTASLKSTGLLNSEVSLNVAVSFIKTGL